MWYTFPRRKVRLGDAGAFCFLGCLLAPSPSVQSKKFRTLVLNAQVRAATTQARKCLRASKFRAVSERCRAATCCTRRSQDAELSECDSTAFAFLRRRGL